MGILITPLDPRESDDLLEPSIDAAGTYQGAGVTLPTGTSIPTTYSDVEGSITDSTGAPIQQSFNKTIALSAPLTPNIPYSTYNTLGRL